MRRAILLLALFLLAGDVGAEREAGNFSLYLVRHAEKQLDGTRDPPLTEAGRQRAQRLAGWLADKDIADIWSSDYRRTRETAAPLGALLGREPLTYDAGNQHALRQRLLENQHNALVVGHSNTIPELARLLCACPIEEMDDSEYDRLIVVSVTNGAPRATTLRQDNPLPATPR